MNLFFLTLGVLIASCCGVKAYSSSRRTNYFKVPYAWSQVEFGFPSYSAKRQAEANGKFVPANAIPIDVQPHYYSSSSPRTFVTVPRFQSGIPYTLATISNKMGVNGPLLKAYPDYASHDNKNGTNCDAISSAVRVSITECNQMWVIDSGDKKFDCPPQLLLFDLNTDKLIHRYRFPTSVYTRGVSSFLTPLAVVRDPAPYGNCSRTMVYVADVSYHGLAVYDYLQDKAWRVENMFMYPDPYHGLQHLAGEEFVIMDGIISLASDKQNLYFHPLSSDTEFAVPLRIIDNSTLFEDNVENMYEAFKPLGQRSSECAASAMDSKHNLYCVTLDPIELIVWNVKTQYDKYNLKKLPISSKVLEFVSGMKVIRNPKGEEELWMMSNRFQKVMTGTRDFNEVNFRVVVVPLTNAFSTSLNDDSANNEVIVGAAEHALPGFNKFLKKFSQTNYNLESIGNYESYDVFYAN